MLPVVVRSHVGAGGKSMEGKIDSGEDICAIPEDLVAELDLPPVRQVRAAGYDGTHHEVLLFHCELELAGQRFPPVEAVATRRRYAIIGRIVLEGLVARLDGPQRMLTVALARRRTKN
jgi:predicted aspartyl protease